MKLLNIGGIIIALVLFLITAYLMGQVADAKWYGFYSDYSAYFPDNKSVDLTYAAVLFMIVFLILNTLGYTINLMKVKTPTSKVMSIIGLSVTFLLLLVDLLIMSSPNNLSFDESGGFFIVYSFVNLAFYIVLLVQVIKLENQAFRKEADQIRIE